VLLPLFIFVGIIEVISIAIRPVSLSFRLFGNIYAGETLLHTMGSVGASLPTPLNWLSLILFPLPFYFLELLVGLLQAFVFAMLCAVYIKLSTDHGGEAAH
jgi:F-type H+-transporting ATPase subunit a